MIWRYDDGLAAGAVVHYFSAAEGAGESCIVVRYLNRALVHREGADIKLAVNVERSVGMRSGSTDPDPSRPGVPKAPAVAKIAAVAGAPAGSVTPPGSNVPASGPSGVASPPSELPMTKIKPAPTANKSKMTTPPMTTQVVVRRPPSAATGAAATLGVAVWAPVGA